MERFLKALSNRFDALGASVGHVKIIVEAAGGFVVANLTGTVETLTIRGADFAAHEARMTLNARVEMSPETLESIVQEELALCLGETVSSSQVALRCLSPGRPQPSYRFEHVVTLSQSK